MMVAGVAMVATVKKLNTAVVASHIEEKEEKSRSESSE
jgi:hypothetical protein